MISYFPQDLSSVIFLIYGAINLKFWSAVYGEIKTRKPILITELY